MEPVSRTPSTEDRLLTVGKMLGLGFLGLAVGIVTQIALLLVLIAAGVDVLDSPLLSVGLSLVSLQGVGLAVVGVLYLRYSGYGLSFVGFRFPTLRDVAWTVGGFVAMVAVLLAAASVLQAISSALGVETAENSIVQTASEDPTVLFLLIPAAFLIIGPSEELLFRGIIQGRLREVFGPLAGILIASTIFGFAHLTAFAATAGSIASVLIPIGGLTAVSLVLGYTYEKTDNLVVPALIHGAYDALLFSLLYVTLVYGDELQAAANNSSGVLAALF
ncbi:CPBP family intramembrane glutamic endopeptidase [Halomarina rubra]|uniref:CPBP family intramembrane glutamic endopeptidase n=1 Tax=Halomarina rubra TaxID=2071873 RepID=A0ABD6AS68_9EURY|nr:type II CAAX endopeptidase family protein [Halomarina rubra]